MRLIVYANWIIEYLDDPGLIDNHSHLYMHVYLYYALDSINKQTVFISTTAKPSLNILSAIYLTLGLLSEEMKNSNIQPEQIC